jgi:hypothetical protein
MSKRIQFLSALILIRRAAYKISFAGVLVGLASAAMAQTSTGWFNMSSIRTGWNDDVFGVLTSQAMVNPAACSYPDAYMTIISQAGYKTHYAAALLAQAASKQINLTISNTICTQSRPTIIGVEVR